MKILAKIALAGLAVLALVGSLIVAQPASAAPFHHTTMTSGGAAYGTSNYRHRHRHRHHHHSGPAIKIKL